MEEEAVEEADEVAEEEEVPLLILYQKQRRVELSLHQQKAK